VADFAVREMKIAARWQRRAGQKFLLESRRY
jgi:hypothetical protein